MPEVTLSATVSPEGKLLPLAPSVWIASMREFAGKRVDVTVATEALVRTGRANRYWFGVVVPAFQQIWSEPRVALGLPGYTKLQAHEVLVEILAGFDEGPLGTHVRKRTSKMPPPVFAKLIEDARELGREQYRIYLPEPGERYEA